ncbi:glycosyltransferase [Candidatus Thiosymbion oneisti]|uniref:glycosyltransferase n=1 Tax=Candidatus Thiosymbion oneisti TaxID=589554 RepID=UPI00159F127C|nr:glycosyltransferase [Candidatus Thiosymbion oneisti]
MQSGSKMLILHIITTIDRGGAENHLAELVSGQIAKGHAVAVAYLKGNGYWAEYYRKLSVEVFPLGLKRYGDIKPLLLLRKAISVFRPDVVHAHMPPAELYGRLSLIGASSSIVFIISKHLDGGFFHGSEGQTESLLGAASARLVARRAKHVIAVSQAVKNFVTSELVGLPTDEVTVVRHGIGTDAYEGVSAGAVADIRRRFGITDDEITIGTVARLVPQKSLHILLAAFSRFHARAACKSKLLIIGTGPLEADLRKLADDLDISESVVWAGFREDIPVLMKAMDVFALTSEYEGFGVVLIEAMAAEKPVIASCISAIPEVVEDGVSGILYPYGDVSALVDGLERLLDASVRKRYGEAGKARVYECFSPGRMVAQTLSLYG